MDKISILYEDSEILIVNKPYGLSVQGGAGVTHSLDVELSKQVGYKVNLVHRLDKETCGLLVVAKNASCAGKWTSLVGSHQVSKTYSALCVGRPQKSQGKLVSTVVAKDRNQNAELFYRVLDSFTVECPSPAGNESSDSIHIELSLMEITLGTGRKHQIRIQMAQAGYPLVQDDLHGNFKVNKQLRRAGYRKMCLAATKLTVPVNGNPMEFTVPLPEHFNR